MTFPCCKNCPDRYPGCSGACELYEEKRKEFDKMKRYLNPNPALKGYVYDATRKNKDETIKRKQRGRK